MKYTIYKKLKERHAYANIFFLTKSSTKKISFLKNIYFYFLIIAGFFKELYFYLANRVDEHDLCKEYSFENKSLWVFESENNFRSLAPIARSFENPVFFSFGKRREYWNEEFECFRLNKKVYKNDFNYLIYKYLVLIGFLVSNKYSNLFFRAVINSFDRNEYCFRYLSNSINFKKPIFGITSNDINSFTRMVLYVLKENKVPRFYVQHASVSSLFPKLDFTKAFLFGANSIDMYNPEKNGLLPNYILVGNHMMDNFGKVANKKPDYEAGNVINLGIAYNSLDSIQLVGRTIKLINNLKNIQCRIILKPHPREMRSHPKGRFDVRNELSAFISEIDLLLTGLSGIVLDAALCNIPVFEMNCFIDKKLRTRLGDYYGFEEHGIVHKTEKEEFIEILTKIYHGETYLQKNRLNCHHFDASIGTPWEFQVSEKIGNSIKRIIN